MRSKSLKCQSLWHNKKRLEIANLKLLISGPQVRVPAVPTKRNQITKGWRSGLTLRRRGERVTR
jgi:hypothetical protein